MCSTSVPPTAMLPVSGSISRLIIFMVVVLPQPDGPTSTTTSPAGMRRLTSSTAAPRWPGYRLLTPVSSIAAPRVPWAACSAAGAARTPRCTSRTSAVTSFGTTTNARSNSSASTTMPTVPASTWFSELTEPNRPRPSKIWLPSPGPLT